MDLGTTQFATGIAVRVFDDFLKELQVKKAINHILISKPFQLIEGNEDFVITGHAEGEMDPPVFAMHERPNGDLYTRLDLSGNIKLWVSSPEAESPPLFTFEVSVSFLVGLELVPRPGQAPLLRISYDGIESYSGPLSQEDLEQLLLSQNLQEVFQSMEFDIITPVIQSIEAIYGPQPGGVQPGHDEFPVSLKLMKGDEEHVDAFGILVDLPLVTTEQPETLTSFVPNGSEIVFHVSRRVMDILLQKGEQVLRDWLDGYSDKLSVTKLNIYPQADYIYVDGRGKDTEYGIKGSIKGPMYFHLFPGSKNIYLNIRDVNIGIDLPWWLDVIVFLIGESDTVEGIPDIAQQMISDTANNMIRNLTNSLDLDLDVEGVRVIVYPDRLDLNNGEINLYLQVLSHPISETVQSASYSTLRRKFMIFYLESGRRFATEDLARFMSEGLVEVPGYHQVAEKYIRANPDEETRNNLYETWGRP